MAETGADVQPNSGDQPPAPNPGGDPPPAPPARPDWLPEKFFDATTGQPRTEQLAKSYGELERQRAKFADDARAAVHAELFGKRPEKPDAYELGAPEDVTDLVLLTEQPGADFQPEPGKSYVLLKPDDPLMSDFRQLAHRAGLDPAEFKGYLAKFGRALASRVPTEEEAQTARDAAHAEIYRALGEHGERRVQHLQGQIRGILGDRADAVLGMAPSAALVEALEVMMDRAGGARFSAPAAGVTGRLTEAELREKMRDPRYADSLRRDPAYVAEIERGWKTLYPN